MSCLNIVHGILAMVQKSGNKRHGPFIVNPAGKCPLTGRVVSDYNPTQHSAS